MRFRWSIHIRMIGAAACFAGVAISLPLAAQTSAGSAARSGIHGRDGEIHNADTLAWWHTTEFLSSDAMEGRDTGSAAYERAAEYVAARFKQAGLQPAGALTVSSSNCGASTDTFLRVK